MGVSFESTENIISKRTLCDIVYFDVWDEPLWTRRTIRTIKKNAPVLKLGNGEIKDFIFAFIAL